MTNKKVTTAQYKMAQKKLARCEKASYIAMRNGDQSALDKASSDGAKYLAIIADYKSQVKK